MPAKRRGAGLLLGFQMVLPPQAKGVLPWGQIQLWVDTWQWVLGAAGEGERRAPTPRLWARGCLRGAGHPMGLVLAAGDLLAGGVPDAKSPSSSSSSSSSSSPDPVFPARWPVAYIMCSNPGIAPPVTQPPGQPPGGGGSPAGRSPCAGHHPPYQQLSAPGVICWGCVPMGEGDPIMTVIPPTPAPLCAQKLLLLLLLVVLFHPPASEVVLGHRDACASSRLLAQQNKWPQGCKTLGGGGWGACSSPPHPCPLFKRLRVGKVWQGRECTSPGCWGCLQVPWLPASSCWWPRWPQGAGESVAGVAELGGPVGIPITWTRWPSSQHGGGLLPSLGPVCPPFPHPWLGNGIAAEVPGSSGDGPHHGVTLFPSALLQLGLGMGLARPPPAAQGGRAGGLRPRCFGDRRKPISSPSFGPFSPEHLPGELVDPHCPHLCVVPGRRGKGKGDTGSHPWLPHPYIPKLGRSLVA